MTSVRASSLPSTAISPAGTTLTVRWTMSINAWHEPFGIFDATSSPRHRTIALVLELHRDTGCGPAGRLQAWLELGGHRRTVLAPISVRCSAARNGGSEHIDVYRTDDHDPAARLLALSIDAGEQLRFAQCSLLAAAGLRGGTYDPPSINR